MLALPIDDFVPEIVARLRARRALVVTAAPGAGKTTRVPPALVDDGPVLLLQPRRVAARSIARRIAEERGWTLGRDVGWHVRFDRMFTGDTRLIVATEGMLTARLQQDPLLSRFRTLVLDEFHERSVHADLGLALAREAWRARDDLRLVVMSATMAAEPVAAYLDDCPVVAVPGRTHAVDVRYRPGAALAEAVGESWSGRTGAVLCFLSGAREIGRAAAELSDLTTEGVPAVPLHGGLDADTQDAALRPTSARRVILATNLAETTVTVPDVIGVVDSGRHKVARFDAARGIDSLETERISRDSADQRAGRAGRTGPGIAIRLWDARDRLRGHREAEIARVDLSSTVLDVLAWGGDPRTLAWFEAPPVHALDGAWDLLVRLEAIDASGAVTPLGRQMHRLPLHPRLARMLIAGGGAAGIALACALLSERRGALPAHGATTCDLLSAVDAREALPPHIRHLARELGNLVARGLDVEPTLDEAGFRRAVLAAYPDRVAKRRAPKGDRVLLASGAGARLARESGVRDAEYLVAVDVAGAAGGDRVEALVRIATAIDPAWLTPTDRRVVHRLDAARDRVRAIEQSRYGAIALGERHVAPDPVVASTLVQEEYGRRGPSNADRQLLARLAFAGVDVPFDDLLATAAAGAAALGDVQLDRGLDHVLRRRLETGAPASVVLANGRHVRLEYRDDGRVVARLRLQHAFGVAESPRLGPHRVPVTFELLAPNGRPAQITSDLASFWATGYPEVRKQLRGRYPKHDWRDV
jgi:ATP-dependent helicase HrpB